MKSRFVIFFVLVILLFTVLSCGKKTTKTKDVVTVSQALTEYWRAHTDLTTVLESRDGTMQQINQKIDALASRKDSKDAITEIDALVSQYETQSEQAALHFDKLIRLENAIIPYGTQSKGIFSSICNGIYTKAKDTVVSSGRMVRSGWRVLSGRQSLRQVLNDPESGIPIVSTFAEKIQKHNADRDAAIRVQILANNSQEGAIPLEELSGDTPQQKLNSYLNLPDDNPVKMNIRRDVMYWDEGERGRTANTAKELGETGVKTVGDAYGGGVGEWTNEVLQQHMNEGQAANDKGTCNLTINEDAANNPEITENKTIIITKKNTPVDDPRITIVMNAPQNLVQELPTGDYSIVVLADGFIRSVSENINMVQSQLNVMAKLLKLSENAIVVENIIATPETVFLGQLATVNVSCVSTIGQSLSFAWEITGGTFTNKTASGTDLSFKPTQEGTYTATVTISDSQGHSKTRSVNISVVNANITVEFDSFPNESFTDSKLNPGETATVALTIKNNGTTPLSGLQSIVGTEGITTTTSPANTTISPDETETWYVNITIPKFYSESNAKLIYQLNTFDQANNPVTISADVSIPVEFYVEINEITSPVTGSVLSVTGKVANPVLTTATLFLDNDYEHPIQLNLNNGNFTQQIPMVGSATEVQHVIDVYAISGSLEANDTENFTSQVPVTLFRATLSWDTNNTDVDFWCTDPTGLKCYFGRRTTPSGLQLDVDDTNGYGPENITLTPPTTGLVTGDYLIQVHYWSDHSSEPIYSNCSVVIRQNEGTATETVTHYYGGLAADGDVWTVTTLTYDAVTRQWSQKAINKHSYANPALMPQKK